jgi:uncharacterized small protein (TIGR04563 family)
MSAQRGVRKQKLSVRLSSVGAEVHAESRRLDRPVCWLLRLAWRIARHQIRAIPSRPA